MEKWKLKAETGSTMFAHVSAPAYYNKAVYVTMDDKIYKLDPEDGEILAQNEAKGCMMLLPQEPAQMARSLQWQRMTTVR